MHFDDITYQTDYCDIEATIFFCNLLKNRPESIKNGIDINELFQGLSTILSDTQMEYLGTFLAALPGMRENKYEEDIRDLISNNSSLPPRIMRLVFPNYRDVAREIRACMLATIPPDRSIYPVSETEKRLAELIQILNLNEHEAKFVKLILLKNDGQWLMDNALKDRDVWYRNAFRKFCAPLLEISEKDAAKLLSADSALFSMGIIERPSPAECYTIEDGIRAYLNGTSVSTTLADAIFETLKTSPDVRKPVNVADKTWNILQALLTTNGGTNLIFYGAPGTGKTTLAVALAQAGGFQPISIRSPAEGRISERIFNLQCAVKMAESSTARLLIVVDEADQLLGTRLAWSMFGVRTDKGWLNKLMDSNRVKIIWITNCIEGIDPSTMRRFQFSLEFKNYTDRQRRMVWKEILSNSPEVLGNLSDDDVAVLASKYKLQPAHIVDSIRQIAQQNLESGEQRAMLEEFLASHSERLHGSRHSRSAALTMPSSHTSIEGLSTDHDLNDILGTLQIFNDRLQADDGRMQIRNMNLLLSGPPGTGKTEFAKLAAKTLDMELTVRSASQLKSMWVGGTEKNIANAFHEAERDKSILFIDEADSFLWPRESAERSYEVSSVNEFLTQMENFRGILICASNHIDRFDDAAIRRFNFKVKFDYLRPDGVLVMFRRVLGRLVSKNGDIEFTQEQLKRLRTMDLLTPGDFKVVLQQHGFLEDGSVEVDRLIDALEMETRYRRGRGGRTVQLVKS